MRKVAVASVVCAFLLAISGMGRESAVAQETKKPGVSAAGKIEINEGKDGKYRFFVRDAEGKLLAMSGPGGFESTKDAETAIQHLKEVARTAKATAADTKNKAAAAQSPAATGGKIEVKEGKDGKYRAFVRDKEGKLLAMSGPTGFSSQGDALQDVDRLKDALRTAKVTVKTKKD